MDFRERRSTNSTIPSTSFFPTLMRYGIPIRSASLNYEVTGEAFTQAVDLAKDDTSTIDISILIPPHDWLPHLRRSDGSVGTLVANYSDMFGGKFVSTVSVVGTRTPDDIPPVILANLQLRRVDEEAVVQWSAAGGQVKP